MIKTLGHSAILVLLSAMWMVCAYAQDRPDPLSLKVLADSMEHAPKPILMLISTDWCSYCQLQKAQLAKRKNLKEMIQHAYYVELDAESTDTLIFDDKPYAYINNGASKGIHELAIALGGDNGNLAYPTWVLLDSHYNVLFRLQGLLNKASVKFITAEIAKEKPLL